MAENDVYDLENDEMVGCYFCMRVGDHRTYRAGEAFLAGPGHSPCDANANYICMDHLDEDAVLHRDGQSFHPSTPPSVSEASDGGSRSG